MQIRKVWSSGARKVRLGEKRKKRFVVFDCHYWHVPDDAQILGGDSVWCQHVSYYDPDCENDLGKYFVSIGGVEVIDDRYDE